MSKETDGKMSTLVPEKHLQAAVARTGWNESSQIEILLRFLVETALAQPYGKQLLMAFREFLDSVVQEEEGAAAQLESTICSCGRCQSMRSGTE